MKLFKIRIITVFLFCFCFSAKAQIDHDKAHRRYWYYRTRLINDFMKIGKNQGECIILAERNNDVKRSKIGPDQIDIINQYIMALCLEYKILSRGSQDKSETLNEIYHLLYSINRLDLEAEQFWSDVTSGSSQNISQNGPLNGFALREDMTKNFLGEDENKDHFNYERKLGYANPKSFTGLDFTDDRINDEFVGFFEDSKDRSKLVWPQDKYHSLLVALMFVVKYIPSGTGCYINNQLQYFQDFEWDIKAEAKKMANRVYDYIHADEWWILPFKNKTNTIVSYMAPEDGGFATEYSWPLSKMACHVNNGFPFTESNFYCNSKGLLHPYATTAGWGSYNLLCSTTPGVEDNAVFQAWDEAGSNSDPNSAFPLINISLIMQTLTGPFHLEWAELLRKVLHQDKVLYRQLNTYADVISQAPCHGPYNFGSCDHGGWEWSAQDRLEHPKYRGRACNATNDEDRKFFPGNYPGVDYMLLHNLYYEYMNQITIDGNNGNASANAQSGGNSAGSVFAAIGNFISNVAQTVVNSVSNFINTTLPVYICNISNSITGVNLNCSNTSNANIPVPYLGYNLMDNFDNSLWPRKLTLGFGSGAQSIMLGTNSTPAKISVFQNLTSNANIKAQSPVCGNCVNMQSLYEQSSVIYRAGKEITLLPGFTVEPGANFHAYIARYLCSGNGDPMTMRTAGDSTQVDSLDYLSDNFMQFPLHAVENTPSDSDLNPTVNDSTGQSSKVQHGNTNTNKSELANQSSEKDALSQNQILFKRFTVVPNPNEGLFKIYCGRYNDEEKISISLYDSKGIEIRRYENVYEVLEIDLSEYGKGIYLVKMLSSLRNEQRLKKIVIQ